MPLIFAALFGLFALAHTAPFPFLLEALRPAKSVWHVDQARGSQPTIYLTFDDGPNLDWTPPLLDALRDNDARATFFLIDQHITDDTAPIVRRIADEGHGIGLHSGTRRLMITEADDLAVTLRQAAGRISEITGREPCRLFRPHAGWRSTTMYQALEKIDYRLAGWSWGMWDFDWWRERQPDRIAERLARKASAGDIIVIHDGHHKNPRADRHHAAETVRRLTPTLQSRGFTFDALCAPTADAAAGLSQEQVVAGRGPWFGLRLPPGLGKVPAVVVGSRGPRPVTFPAGEPTAPELEGNTMRADVDAIVGFSRDSRERREIGNGQLWGRIAGFPSATKTVNWAVDQFRNAGISDTRIQPITQEARGRFWLPLSWAVRLLGDPSFGAGTSDVVLQSAIPLAPSEIPNGMMTAPLVYVGYASPAVAEHIDVKGKIAVQIVIPQAHMVFERATAVPRAQELFKRGAVAVFNIMRQPGNEHARDFSNCGGPCLNIGGRDGHFLEQVFEKAAQAGVADNVRAEISLKTESRANLTAENGVAIIPGAASDEAILLNAHVDGWFDGAGDNADGLAVLVALARQFARPENRPRRTLIFVASAGHHSPGINGPRNFVAANPDLARRTMLVVNIEHVAQRSFSPSRAVAEDGYREAIADAGEAPIVAGVSNRSPFLNGLFNQGVLRYGVNFVSDDSAMQSGETGGYAALDVARVTIMQAPPLYHTTGEVSGVISTPGLERIARFLAFFVKEVDRAAATAINP